MKHHLQNYISLKNPGTYHYLLSGVSLFFILTAVLFFIPAHSLAATSPTPPTTPATSSITITNALGTTGQIDWYTNTVRAVGVGFSPAKKVAPDVTSSPAALKIMARYAAVEDAQRNLVKAIMAIPVNGTSTLGSLATPELSLEEKAVAVAAKFKIIAEKPLVDGSYQVFLQADLNGKSGVAALVDSTVKRPAAPVFPETTAAPSLAAATENYTGLILELVNLPLNRTFCPVIYDNSNRLVYSPVYLPAGNLVNRGFIQYSQRPEDIRAAEKVQSRVGINPMIIKAISLQNNNNDIVISTEDADKLLAANIRTGILEKCLVVVRLQQSEPVAVPKTKNTSAASPSTKSNADNNNSTPK